MATKVNRNDYVYRPSRFWGVVFLLFVFLVLVVLEAGLVTAFLNVEVGLVYFLLLIGMVACLVPLAFIGYRLFSLVYSSYSLDRDGLHIHWGFRRESVPLNAIEWIRHPEEMPYEIPWSRLPMPGAYLGTVSSPNYPDFEFLASDMSKMLFIGTPRYVYVISPVNGDKFIEGFERIAQMGVLNDIEWETVRPMSWFLEAWNDRIGRRAFIISLNLLTALFIWIGLRFPFVQTVAVQFSATGETQEILPVINVLILPILASLCFVCNTLIGMRMFRKEENRLTAQMVWIAGCVILAQFLIAGIYLMR